MELNAPPTPGGSQVRIRLTAGGRRIRTSSPAHADPARAAKIRLDLLELPVIGRVSRGGTGSSSSPPAASPLRTRPVCNDSNIGRPRSRKFDKAWAVALQTFGYPERDEDPEAGGARGLGSMLLEDTAQKRGRTRFGDGRWQIALAKL